MKYKEMQLICSKYRKCDKCPLNCIDDWDIWAKNKHGALEVVKHATWCIKNMRERYENKYRMHMDRGEKEKANKTIQEYIAMERKYLKQKD